MERARAIGRACEPERWHRLIDEMPGMVRGVMGCPCERFSSKIMAITIGHMSIVVLGCDNLGECLIQGMIVNTGHRLLWEPNGIRKMRAA